MFFFILNGPFGLQLGPTQGEVLCRGVAGGGGGAWGARDPPW